LNDKVLPTERNHSEAHLKRFAAIALLATLVGLALGGCIFVPDHGHDHEHEHHEDHGGYRY